MSFSTEPRRTGFLSDRVLDRIVGLAVLVAFVPAAFALEPTEWRNRQALAVERAGLVKIVLPPVTLDLARPGLEDVRLLDPSGREVPYVVDGPTLAAPPISHPPASFRATLNETSTQLFIETGTAAPLHSVQLMTPAADFIKAVRVEVATDNGGWETLVTGAPVFRQFGAEQLAVGLEGHSAQRMRLTLDDTSARAVPFTAATLWLSAAKPAPTLPLDIRVTRREEFAGETLLTLDLGAAHVPLAALDFVTPEVLFARNVSVGVRELRDEMPGERVVASGSIYRVSVDGLAPRAQLEMPLHLVPTTRELLVHVANGDSPPLALTDVRVRQRPIWLIFQATEPGSYALLTGHNQVVAPHYDLTALRGSLKEAIASDLTLAAPIANPGYRRPEVLADTPLRGAVLDSSPWPFRKAVLLANEGVQQLELEPDVLAHAQPDFGDLRLVREGTQVPYLLERTSLARAIPLTFTLATDPKRPRVACWEIKLPRAGLPITRLTLKSSTPLFQRHVRLLEKISDERRGSYERTVAEGNWSKVPGSDRALVLPLVMAPQAETLFLETDNGDNPTIVLSAAEVAYPVVRLIFKPESAPVALYYGNRTVAAPRYDLSLVAERMFTAEKSVATLGPEDALKGGPTALGLDGGAWFWGALALVVIGLLVVVAKLLPKPPSTG